MKALEILKKERLLVTNIDGISIDEAIAELEALQEELSTANEAYSVLLKQYHALSDRTCDTCKHYDGSHKCNNENSIAYETSNRVYGDDFCKDYEPKDNQ